MLYIYIYIYIQFAIKKTIQFTLTLLIICKGGRGGRRGMLAGLRGREIGMFFAARSRAKKERQEIEMVYKEFYIILIHYELW